MAKTFIHGGWGCGQSAHSQRREAAIALSFCGNGLSRRSKYRFPTMVQGGRHNALLQRLWGIGVGKWPQKMASENTGAVRVNLDDEVL